MRPPLDDPSFPPLPRILVDNERLESLEPKLRAFIKRYNRAEYTFLSNARRWSSEYPYPHPDFNVSQIMGHCLLTDIFQK